MITLWLVMGLFTLFILNIIALSRISDLEKEPTDSISKEIENIKIACKKIVERLGGELIFYGSISPSIYGLAPLNEEKVREAFNKVGKDIDLIHEYLKVEKLHVQEGDRLVQIPKVQKVIKK